MPPAKSGKKSSASAAESAAEAILQSPEPTFTEWACRVAMIETPDDWQDAEAMWEELSKLKKERIFILTKDELVAWAQNDSHLVIRYALDDEEKPITPATLGRLLRYWLDAKKAEVEERIRQGDAYEEEAAAAPQKAGKKDAPKAKKGGAAKTVSAPEKKGSQAKLKGSKKDPGSSKTPESAQTGATPAGTDGERGTGTGTGEDGNAADDGSMDPITHFVTNGDASGTPAALVILRDFCATAEDVLALTTENPGPRLLHAVIRVAREEMSEEESESDGDDEMLDEEHSGANDTADPANTRGGNTAAATNNGEDTTLLGSLRRFLHSSTVSAIPQPLQSVSLRSLTLIFDPEVYADDPDFQVPTSAQIAVEIVKEIFAVCRSLRRFRYLITTKTPLVAPTVDVGDTDLQVYNAHLSALSPWAQNHVPSVLEALLAQVENDCDVDQPLSPSTAFERTRGGEEEEGEQCVGEGERDGGREGDSGVQSASEFLNKAYDALRSPALISKPNSLPSQPNTIAAGSVDITPDCAESVVQWHQHHQLDAWTSASGDAGGRSNAWMRTMEGADRAVAALLCTAEMTDPGDEREREREAESDSEFGTRWTQLYHFIAQQSALLGPDLQMPCWPPQPPAILRGLTFLHFVRLVERHDASREWETPISDAMRCAVRLPDAESVAAEFVRVRTLCPTAQVMAVDVPDLQSRLLVLHTRVPAGLADVARLRKQFRRTPLFCEWNDPIFKNDLRAVFEHPDGDDEEEEGSDESDNDSATYESGGETAEKQPAGAESAENTENAENTESPTFVIDNPFVLPENVPETLLSYETMINVGLERILQQQQQQLPNDDDSGGFVDLRSYFPADTANGTVLDAPDFEADVGRLYPQDGSVVEFEACGRMTAFWPPDVGLVCRAGSGWFCAEAADFALGYDASERAVLCSPNGLRVVSDLARREGLTIDVMPSASLERPRAATGTVEYYDHASGMVRTALVVEQERRVLSDGSVIRNLDRVDTDADADQSIQVQLNPDGTVRTLCDGWELTVSVDGSRSASAIADEAAGEGEGDAGKVGATVELPQLRVCETMDPQTFAMVTTREDLVMTVSWPDKRVRCVQHIDGTRQWTVPLHSSSTTTVGAAETRAAELLMRRLGRFATERELIRSPDATLVHVRHPPLSATADAMPETTAFPANRIVLARCHAPRSPLRHGPAFVLASDLLTQTVVRLGLSADVRLAAEDVSVATLTDADWTPEQKKQQSGAKAAHPDHSDEVKQEVDRPLKHAVAEAIAATDSDRDIHRWSVRTAADVLYRCTDGDANTFEIAVDNVADSAEDVADNTAVDNGAASPQTFVGIVRLFNALHREMRRVVRPATMAVEDFIEGEGDGERAREKEGGGGGVQLHLDTKLHVRTELGLDRPPAVCRHLPVLFSIPFDRRPGARCGWAWMPGPPRLVGLDQQAVERPKCWVDDYTAAHTRAETVAESWPAIRRFQHCVEYEAPGDVHDPFERSLPLPLPVRALIHAAPNTSRTAQISADSNPHVNHHDMNHRVVLAAAEWAQHSPLPAALLECLQQAWNGWRHWRARKGAYEGGTAEVEDDRTEDERREAREFAERVRMSMRMRGALEDRPSLVLIDNNADPNTAAAAEHHHHHRHHHHAAPGSDGDLVDDNVADNDDRTSSSSDSIDRPPGRRSPRFYGDTDLYNGDSDSQTRGRSVDSDYTDLRNGRPVSYWHSGEGHNALDVLRFDRDDDVAVDEETVEEANDDIEAEVVVVDGAEAAGVGNVSFEVSSGSSSARTPQRPKDTEDNARRQRYERERERERDAPRRRKQWSDPPSASADPFDHISENPDDNDVDDTQQPLQSLVNEISHIPGGTQNRIPSLYKTAKRAEPDPQYNAAENATRRRVKTSSMTLKAQRAGVPLHTSPLSLRKPEAMTLVQTGGADPSLLATDGGERERDVYGVSNLVVHPAELRLGNLCIGCTYRIPFNITNLGDAAGRYSVRIGTGKKTEGYIPSSVVRVIDPRVPLAAGMTSKMEVEVFVDPKVFGGEREREGEEGEPVEWTEVLDIRAEDQRVQVPLLAHIHPLTPSGHIALPKKGVRLMATEPMKRRLAAPVRVAQDPHWEYLDRRKVEIYPEVMLEMARMRDPAV